MESHQNFSHEVFEKIESFRKEYSSKEYGKFIGDTVARIFKHYLQKEADEISPTNYKVVGPNVYIAGLPAEYDLFIINSGSKAIRLTNSYHANDVKFVIESKTGGPRFKKGEVEKGVGLIKKAFDNAFRVNNKIQCVYLTFEEVTNPVNNTYDYFKVISDFLKPHHSICLKESRTQTKMLEQWRLLFDLIATNLAKKTVVSPLY
jgi:hypothetical protein